MYELHVLEIIRVDNDYAEHRVQGRVEALESVHSHILAASFGEVAVVEVVVSSRYHMGGSIAFVFANVVLIEVGVGYVVYNVFALFPILIKN